MVSSIAQLPSLTPRESHLLAAFFALNFNPFTLTQQENLSPQDLLNFIESQAVQSHLEAVQTFAESTFKLRAHHARLTALTNLEDLLKTSENPIEKRRAATTLLRGLTPNVPRNSKPSTTNDLQPSETQAWRSVADALVLNKPTPTPSPPNGHRESEAHKDRGGRVVLRSAEAAFNPLFISTPASSSGTASPFPDSSLSLAYRSAAANFTRLTPTSNLLSAAGRLAPITHLQPSARAP